MTINQLGESASLRYNYYNLEVSSVGFTGAASKIDLLVREIFGPTYLRLDYFVLETVIEFQISICVGKSDEICTSISFKFVLQLLQFGDFKMLLCTSMLI